MGGQMVDAGITLERMRRALLGATCYGGLDLSSTTDLTAMVLAFPGIPAGRTSLLPWFWIPAASLAERVRRDRVVYDLWVRQGLITTTPGPAVDYAFVRRDIVAASRLFDVRGIAYDPHNATQLTRELGDQDGLTMVECRQGFLTLSDPSKRLEVMVRRGELAHGGHPILRWMAENCIVRHDPAGNIKPEKPGPMSPQRIDGIVASIMAIWLAAKSPADTGSVYESEYQAPPGGRKRSVYEPDDEPEEAENDS